MKNTQSKVIEGRCPKILFGCMVAILLLSLSCNGSFAASLDTAYQVDASIPTFPAQIYGTICDMNGKPLVPGTVITADVNGLRSTFTITEAGKIGGSGTFDGKFLVNGVGDGDKIIFGIEGTSANTACIYYSDDASLSKEVSIDIDPAGILKKSEIANTVKIANANLKTEMSYEVSTSILKKQKAPTITRNGKTLILDEKVVVKKIVGDVKIDVPATVNSDGTVNIKDADISDSKTLIINFVGRKIGDVSGSGKPGIVDAVKVLQASSRMLKLDARADFYGDVTGDGNTNLMDAVRLLQYSAHMTNENYEI